MKEAIQKAMKIILVFGASFFIIYRLNNVK